MSWLGAAMIALLTIAAIGLAVRYSTLPERLGLRRTHHPLRDKKFHDAVNREQVALSGLELVQRRAARDIRSVVKSQRSEERLSDLRETSEELRQSIEKKKTDSQDTIDAFVRGKRDL